MKGVGHCALSGRGEPREAAVKLSYQTASFVSKLYELIRRVNGNEIRGFDVQRYSGREIGLLEIQTRFGES